VYKLELKQGPQPVQPTQATVTAQQVQPTQETTAALRAKRDSRYIANLDLNAVVDGYLMKDIVRAQRYPYFASPLRSFPPNGMIFDKLMYARRWLMRRHFIQVVEQYHSSDDVNVDKLRHRNKALREV
jgi:hypothetical protein